MGRVAMLSWLKQVLTIWARPDDGIAAATVVKVTLAAEPHVELATAAPATQRRRALAGQLAVTARLNVKAGKTPRRATIGAAKAGSAKGAARRNGPTAPRKERSVAVAAKKRAPQSRSVFLQARHLAPKSVVVRQSNVVVLASRTKTVRPVARTANARGMKLAA